MNLEWIKVSTFIPERACHATFLKIKHTGNKSMKLCVKTWPADHSACQLISEQVVRQKRNNVGFHISYGSSVRPLSLSVYATFSFL